MAFQQLSLSVIPVVRFIHAQSDIHRGQWKSIAQSDSQRRYRRRRRTFRLRRVKVDSLAGKWEDETQWTHAQTTNKAEASASASASVSAPASTAARQEGTRFSPNTGAGIAQDRLEPMLRDKAIELGADIRMNTELMTFKQDSDCITAAVRDRAADKEYEIRAQYMIAADGHRSSVREALGITRSGRGLMRTVRSVLFRAALEEYTASGVTQFNVRQPDLEAFLTTYGDGTVGSYLRGRRSTRSGTAEVIDCQSDWP